MTLQEWCEQNDRSDLLNEWHPTKNGNLKPSDVMPGSNKKVWWYLPYDDSETGKHFDFEWEARISNRVYLGYKCPYLSGQRVWYGFNDLLSQCPEIAKEWHPTKNGELRPDSITSGSSKRVWWLGLCGHEWQDSVHHRSREGRGCPICNKHTSFPEKAIYYYIHKLFPDAVSGDRHLGVELDIYIPSKHVAIEYDGLAWHNCDSKVNYDESKNEICLKNDIVLLRVREAGLSDLFHCKIFHINPSPSDVELSCCIDNLLQYFSVIDYDIDVHRDRFDILQLCSNVKNLAKYKPELILEWNYDKNGDLSPNHMHRGSHVKVWWKCEKGHEWQASVCDRIQGKGCPYCTNRKVLYGFNDLLSQYPEIAKEWHPTKNGDLTPACVTSKSAKSVWWQCEKGHEWKSQIYNRTNGKGCPKCNGGIRKAVKNIDTDEVFLFLKDASCKYNIHPSSITSCCKGRYNTAGGYHWKYVDEEKELCQEN